MTVTELISELEKLNPDLNVMAAGECADKVIVETCGDHSYVRIFEPLDVEFTSRFDVYDRGTRASGWLHENI